MGNVLVFDDGRAVCDLMCEGLRREGLSVECTFSDTAAYRRITALPTLDALVINTDQRTGISGYEIARFARTVIQRIAVVYVSREVSPSSLKTSVVAGSEFLVQPFPLSVLIETVTHKIKLWRGAA